MSEFRRLKEKFKNCYLNGFFLDKNTFLKGDDAELVMAWRRDDDGRPIQKPMVVLKKAVEMIVDHRGKIVAVECKEKLGVWVDAFEDALESFNKQT
jgi:hypothetical protein